MEGDASMEVHLYIYDLTKGMAQVMSAAFLGKWELLRHFKICDLKKIFFEQAGKLMESGIQELLLMAGNTFLVVAAFRVAFL